MKMNKPQGSGWWLSGWRVPKIPNPPQPFHFRRVLLRMDIYNEKMLCIVIISLSWKITQYMLFENWKVMNNLGRKEQRVQITVTFW
jgi:hypothetical protein